MTESSQPSACWDAYHYVNKCTWSFVFKTLFLSILLTSIVIGNSLVILAIILYRKLRNNISNLFIASLAVADLLLGVTVLPFSLSLEVMGYWAFGRSFCSVYLSVDIWMCTASILHLCVISFDRYVAIAFPLHYPNLITKRRCKILCLTLWILSLAISFPALVRWDRKVNFTTSNSTTPSSQQENTTFTSTYIHDSITPVQLNASSTLPHIMTCELLSHNSIGYILYSAMGSFFIPCFIMVAFYVKIFSEASRYMDRLKNTNMDKLKKGKNLRVHTGVQRYELSSHSVQSSPVKYDIRSYRNNKASYDKQLNGGKPTIKQHQDNIGLKLSTSSQYENGDITRSASGNITRDQTPLLKTRRKTELKLTLSKETRAAKTLAVIVGCFIVCWAPFFICYVIQGVSKIVINDILYQIFIWLGYANSMFNPCIYAFFSNDYRHAFKRIVKCQLKTKNTVSGGLVRKIASLYVPSSPSRTSVTYAVTKSQTCPNIYSNDTAES